MVEAGCLQDRCNIHDFCSNSYARVAFYQIHHFNTNSIFRYYSIILIGSFIISIVFQIIFFVLFLVRVCLNFIHNRLK